MGLGGNTPPGLVILGSSTGYVLVSKQSKVKNVFLATQVANVITYYSVGGPFSAVCLNFLRRFFKIAEYLQILRKIINYRKHVQIASVWTFLFCFIHIFPPDIVLIFCQFFAIKFEFFVSIFL